MIKKLILSIAIAASLCSMAQASLYYSEPLEVATQQLLSDQWDVGYVNPEYRNLLINYSQSRQVATKWSSVLDSAGKRYGVAFLVDMEKNQILVTPIDEFRTAGVHYVQSRIAQHQNRYQWDFFSQKATQEKAEHDYLVAKDEKIQRQRELDSIKKIYQNKLDHELSDVKKQQVALTKIVDKAVASTNNQKVVLTKTVTKQLDKLKKQQEQLDVEKNRLAKLSGLVAKQQQTAIQSTKTAQEILSKKGTNTTSSISNEQPSDSPTVTTSNIKTLPSVASNIPPHTLVAGLSSVVVKNYLHDNWGYALSWSDNLLSKTQRHSVKLDYDMKLGGKSLNDDLSTIVCALTRDVPGIAIYAEVDDSSKVVFMQMHKGSFAIRKEILAECYQ